KSYLTEPVSVAVYPCAGMDTMPFTFTHPEVYKHRRVSAVPSPNVFVYIDKEDPFDRDDPTLTLNDGRTRIETKAAGRIKVDNRRGYQFDIIWQSLDSPDWMTVRERHLMVLYVIADWRWFAVHQHNVGWVPDTFIGVCDGCSFGGNPECVNPLTTHGLPHFVLRDTPVSKYYITDHFKNAKPVGNLRDGDSIYSMDDRFPYRFKKLALLGSDWGLYGRAGEMRGATLFELERRFL
ncbi:MAG: hypothetical protein V2B18_25745, partial [Pseudomonadota bacterium]